MPVPTAITDLSTTAGSNSPSGSESVVDGDNYVRAHASFIATLRDQLNGTASTGTLKTPVFSGVPTGTVTGDVYTPTTTAISNVTSATVQNAFYSRIGNIVTVSVYCTITPTAASGGGQFYVTLPVASAFAAASDAVGVLNGSDSANVFTGFVRAEPSSDKLDCVFVAYTASAIPVCVTAQYKVL